MVKLKFEGEGITCQFGTYSDGWSGEVSKPVAEALLRVPGFSAVQELKEPVRKSRKEDGGDQ